jgi:hypothetical protein
MIKGSLTVFQQTIKDIIPPSSPTMSLPSCNIETSKARALCSHVQHVIDHSIQFVNRLHIRGPDIADLKEVLVF